MCGIFGWSFHRKAKIPEGQRVALASVLAVANSLRGDDSWGFYAMNREGKTLIDRQIGDISWNKNFGELGTLPLVMGHTRAATVGKVSVPNAHPFEVGNIVLAHNGAVYNYEEMNKKYNRTCEVDSMHLAHHLAEGKDTKELEGYGAIEWLNRQANSKESHMRVYLSRMKHGSLSVYGIEEPGKGFNKKRVGVVWSSSEQHLKSALGAARLDCFEYKELPEGEVFYAQAGKFFSTKQRIDLAESETYWNRRGARYSGRGYSYVYSGGQSDWSYESTEAHRCKACDHLHDSKGKCYRFNCDCTDDKAKEKLKAGEIKGKGDAKPGDLIPFDCGKCNHWHWEYGCARLHCNCTERVKVGEKNDGGTAGQTAGGTVTSLAPRNGLAKIATDTYVDASGHVIPLSDLEVMAMREQEEEERIAWRIASGGEDA